MCRGRKQRRTYAELKRWGILLAGIACLQMLNSCQMAARPQELLQTGRMALRRGEAQTAQQIADRGARQWDREPSSPWHWGFRLLQAEILLNSGQVAAARKLLEPAIPQTPALSEARARRDLSLAIAALKTSDYRQADALLTEARKKATAAQRRDILLEVDIARGSLLSQMRKPAEADATMASALAEARRQHRRYEEALVLVNMGLSRIRKARFDEAVPLLEEALEAATEMKAQRLRSGALTNLGVCYYRLGDFEKSTAALHQAIEVQRRLGLNFELQASLGTLGDANLLAGRGDDAVKNYREALSIAERIQNADFAGLWAGNLASALAEKSDWKGAEELNRHSQYAKQKLGDEGWKTYSGLNAAAIAEGRGDLPGAQDLLEGVLKHAEGNPVLEWDAHAGLARVFEKSGRPAEAMAHYRRAIEIVELTRAGLLQRDFKMTFLNRLIRFYRDYVHLLTVQGMTAEALEAAESSRGRILAKRSGERGAVTPVHNSSYRQASRYQEAARRSGVVFLSYWLAPGRSFLWVVTPTLTRCVPLPDESEINSLVTRYQRAVEVPRDGSLVENPAGQALYSTLLEPVRRQIPPGSRVILVPDGILHGLNFETLPVPGDTPHYWIEDVVLSIAPSLDVALEPREREASAPRSMLAVGDAESVSSDFPRLAFAREELEYVERRMKGYQTQLLTGAQATPVAYRQAGPERYGLIHFAAHGMANRTSPMDSAVILSSQGNVWKLYARDIVDVPLQADLVTLSACRSAGARSYAGEGLVGFAWAFLHAGAKNVIAGLWDVGDSSTAKLMDGLYAGIASGLSPAEALREAKLAFVKSSGNYRKPFYWAPFQVYTRTLPAKAALLSASRR